MSGFTPRGELDQGSSNAHQTLNLCAGVELLVLGESSHDPFEDFRPSLLIRYRLVVPPIIEPVVPNLGALI